MGKIIQFKQDAEYYYNKGIDYSECGNVVDAVACFRTAISLEPDNALNYVELGCSYLEAELYRDAADSLIKALTYDRYIETAYLGLMQAFAGLNDGAAAFYYYREGKRNGVFDDDFGFDDVLERVPKEPRLDVYEDKRDEITLINGSCLMAAGNYDLAETLLGSLKKKSKQYIKARNNLGYLEYLRGNYEKSIELCEEMLTADPCDAMALGNAMVSYHKLGNAQKEAEMAERLNEAADMNDPELYLLAMRYMQADNSEMALRFYERLLQDNAYDVGNLMVYAQALYNVGRREEATRYMIMLRKLYPDNHSVRYFARYIVSGTIDHIPLSNVIPRGENERRKHRVNETFSMLSDLDAVLERLDSDEELLEMTTWMFEIEEYNLCRVVAEFLGQDEKWQDYLRELLIRSDGSAYLKRYYLTNILLYSKKRRIAVCFDGMLRFISPKAPYFANRMAERVYWIAYSAAICYNVKDISGLKESFITVQNRIAATGFDIEKANDRALAALVCNYSAAHEYFKHYAELGAMFDCEGREITEYYERLGLSRKVDAITELMEMFAKKAEEGKLYDLPGVKEVHEENIDENGEDK